MLCLEHIFLYFALLILSMQGVGVYGHNYYTQKRILELREQVRGMFTHAYEGYLKYASGYDELRPLTCDGVDTWGSYSLTLIDALDTLAAMGNWSEFGRVALQLEARMNFDSDINVSVFETNIRVVGGLLSAHLLSKRAGLTLEKGWPCQGPLLRLAEDVAKRLLPAFDTKTGMPYGTVNLRLGVPKGETTVTCTAGVGTFLIEFGALSRLTGNPIYEEVALNAMHALWERRSPIGLFGNHIDVQSGRWTALDSGIGAGVDSYFEYMVKGAVLLNRPELLEMFHEARYAIDKYLKRKDWYMWANMYKGQITLPVFQSLEAFWPGLLSLLGDTRSAIRTVVEYSSIWRKYGFLPEFYNIITGEAPANRESYPLRPELAESLMYLYRSTNNQFLLEMGDNMVQSIEFSAKTKCGFATIRNVVTHEKQNRMESFFLAETTKYLFLLFDEANFMHSDGSAGERWETPNGVCAINSGPYIFNTEAHPIDMSALYCCHDIHEDFFSNLDLDAFNEQTLLNADWEERLADESKNRKYQCAYDAVNTRKSTASRPETNLSVDIEVFDEHDKPAADVLLKNFEKVKTERHNKSQNQSNSFHVNQITIEDLKEFFDKKREHYNTAEDVLNYILGFMQNYTLDSSYINQLQLFDSNVAAMLGAAPIEKQFETRPHTLWELYKFRVTYESNARLLARLNLLPADSDNFEFINNVLKAFNHTTAMLEPGNPYKIIVEKINKTHGEFQIALFNTTSMQEFVFLILKNGSEEKPRTYTPLLAEEEISTLNIPKEMNTSPEKIFENTRKLLDLKKRMMETLERLKVLMEQSQPVTATVTAKPKTEPANTLITEKSSSIENNCDAQPITPATKENKAEALSTQTSRDKEVDNASNSDANTNKGSVWSKLVQTILRKTTTQAKKFDEQELLLKTRKSMMKYSKKALRYELFTCEMPTFIERFAYRDFYP